MGYIANVLIGVGDILQLLFHLYMIVVIGSVVVSWVNVDPYNSVVVIVRKLTDPVYYYIKKYLPFVVLGGLDLSPLVVIIILRFLKKVIIGNIYLLAEDLIRTQM